jgi:hypothetical protein
MVSIASEDEETAMPQQRKTRKTTAHDEPRKRPGSEAEPRLEDRTRVELFEMAHRLAIAGAAEMSKAELVEAIRRR